MEKLNPILWILTEPVRIGIIRSVFCSSFRSSFRSNVLKLSQPFPAGKVLAFDFGNIGIELMSGSGDWRPFDSFTCRIIYDGDKQSDSPSVIPPSGKETLPRKKDTRSGSHRLEPDDVTFRNSSSPIQGKILSPAFVRFLILLDKSAQNYTILMRRPPLWTVHFSSFQCGGPCRGIAKREVLERCFG